MPLVWAVYEVRAWGKGYVRFLQASVAPEAWLHVLCCRPGSVIAKSSMLSDCYGVFDYCPVVGGAR